MTCSIVRLAPCDPFHVPPTYARHAAAGGGEFARRHLALEPDGDDPRPDIVTPVAAAAGTPLRFMYARY